LVVLLIHYAGWEGPAWMGKPYSLDLRKRVVAAIAGGMSRNQAAKQFGVAISTTIGWMQRVEGTGSVAPGQMDVPLVKVKASRFRSEVFLRLQVPEERRGIRSRCH
jgi:transposase-like protein